MNILIIILIALLVILLFKVGLSLLRVLISIAVAVLCIYLAYQGVMWLFDHSMNISIHLIGIYKRSCIFSKDT